MKFINAVKIKVKSTVLAGFVLASLVVSCQTAETDSCNLEYTYTMTAGDAQHYALPLIDFSFSVDSTWQVMPATWGIQNFWYFQFARMNDSLTGSIIVRLHQFKRMGNYISFNEHLQAVSHIELNKHKRDSWITSTTDSVDGWWVNYGYFEQEPNPTYAIAFKPIVPGPDENGVVIQLILPTEAGKFEETLRAEDCLEAVLESIKIDIE